MGTYHLCPIDPSVPRLVMCHVPDRGKQDGDRVQDGEVVAGEHIMRRFDGSAVTLWEIPTAKILPTGRRGLLPLTREGRRHDVVGMAIPLFDS